MKFLRNWLNPERPAGVALHAGRNLEVLAPAAQVYARCIGGIEQILGGHVGRADAATGVIEASFGLINSERLTVRVRPLDDARTAVIIESRRGAVSSAPASSSYVAALADHLLSDCH